MSDIWNIKFDRANDNLISDIQAKLGVSPLTAILLYNRGFTTAEAAAHFLQDDSESILDPMIMRDMPKAALEVKNAIEQGDKILVYGDYDVDGVTSTCLLYQYLISKGANATYYIPRRFEEGYGLNDASTAKIAESGVKLMITVDCGITAVSEVECIHSLGMRVVVTDHHECPDVLPQAEAVVDPHRKDCEYPFEDLCGCGVAFNLACAVEMLYQPDKSIEEIMHDLGDKYADIVAIGTIADVMPLREFNRYIVKVGLINITDNARPGIKALCELADYKVNSTYISFNIAPKLNAAGRIDDATIALSLLLCEDMDKARQVTEQLVELNKKRQDEENAIYQEAIEVVLADSTFADDDILVVAGKGWHQGVIGIVASRMVERYHKPAIMVSIPTDGGVCRVSGRSIKGLNLVESLNAVKEHLVVCGGHELAAGLSVEVDKIADFRKAVNQYAKTHIDREAIAKKPEVECVVRGKDITVKNIDDFSRLEPYGQGNPTPTFALCDAKIINITGVGNNKHIRMVVENDDVMHTVMYFGKAPEDFGFYQGEHIDILCNLDINEFRGELTPKIVCRAVAACQEDRDDVARQRKLHSDITKGMEVTREIEAVPDRTDFAKVYRALEGLSKSGRSHSAKTIIAKSGMNGRNTLCRLLFILEVFSELELVKYTLKEDVSNTQVTFTLPNVSGKTNLDKSPLLQKIRTQQK